MDPGTRARRLPGVLLIGGLLQGGLLGGCAVQPSPSPPAAVTAPASRGGDEGVALPASGGGGLSLASSEEVEQQAIKAYEDLKRQARAQKALAPDDYPMLVRIRRISQRLIPFAPRFNPRAAQWRWEVILIGSKQINAFCMPGGKIAFYTGIVNNLQLTDDEIAVVMGHEMAHALREHGRDQLSKQRLGDVVTAGASILSSVLGYGDLGGQLASGATQLTLLKFSRNDESEADAIGLDLAARAGFDPRAGLTLWQKMAAAASGAQPQFLSTHPSDQSRIDEIRRRLPEVLPLYARAIGRTVDSLPPYPRDDAGAAGAGRR